MEDWITPPFITEVFGLNGTTNHHTGFGKMRQKEHRPGSVGFWGGAEFCRPRKLWQKENNGGELNEKSAVNRK